LRPPSFRPEGDNLLRSGELIRRLVKDDEQLYCASTFNSLPTARHCGCCSRIACAVLSGVPPPAVVRPSPSRRFRISVPSRYWSMARLSLAIASGGVQLGSPADAAVL
jgi:hypothetical protein